MEWGQSTLTIDLRSSSQPTIELVTPDRNEKRTLSMDELGHRRGREILTRYLSKLIEGIATGEIKHFVAKAFSDLGQSGGGTGVDSHSWTLEGINGGLVKRNFHGSSVAWVTPEDFGSDGDVWFKTACAMMIHNFVRFITSDGLAPARWEWVIPYNRSDMAAFWYAEQANSYAALAHVADDFKLYRSVDILGGAKTEYIVATNPNLEVNENSLSKLFAFPQLIPPIHNQILFVVSEEKRELFQDLLTRMNHVKPYVVKSYQEIELDTLRKGNSLMRPLLAQLQRELAKEMDQIQRSDLGLA